MSIASEITRIQGERNKIRTKLIGLGLAASTDLMDDLADAIDAIPNNGAIDATVQEGETYSIPRGYHNGSGTVSGISGGGSYDLQTKTVTPTKSQQTVTPDQGKYGLSSVVVNAIPANYNDTSIVTAAPGDVLATKVFVDEDGLTQTGTMPNNGALSLTIDGLVATSASIPAGYTSGGTVSLTNAIEQALAAI